MHSHPEGVCAMDGAHQKSGGQSRTIALVGQISPESRSLHAICRLAVCRTERWKCLVRIRLLCLFSQIHNSLLSKALDRFEVVRVRYFSVIWLVDSALRPFVAAGAAVYSYRQD